MLLPLGEAESGLAGVAVRVALLSLPFGDCGRTVALGPGVFASDGVCVDPGVFENSLGEAGGAGVSVRCGVFGDEGDTSLLSLSLGFGDAEALGSRPEDGVMVGLCN